MIRTERRLRICTALILLILAFIWGNSLLPGEISGAFSQWVKRVLAQFLPGDVSLVEEGNGLLRKMAHFAEFTALGLCLAWRNGMLGKGFLRTFLSGAAAAAVDETIQRIVPGRNASVLDVLLDCSGVLTGMFLIYLGHTILKKRKVT